MMAEQLRDRRGGGRKLALASAPIVLLLVLLVARDPGQLADEPAKPAGYPPLSRAPHAPASEAPTPPPRQLNAETLPQALLALSNLPAGTDLISRYRELARAWAAFDGEAATRFFLELPPSPTNAEAQRIYALGDALHAWAEADFDAAARFAIAHSTRRLELLPRLVGHLADRDAARLAEWLHEIADPAARSDLLLACLHSGSPAALSTLGNFLVVSPTDPAAVKAAILLTRSSLRSAGAMTTKAWAESLPQGPVRSAGLVEIYQHLVHERPELALEQAAKLPPGPDRDAAATGLARALAENQPVEAAEWLLRVADSELYQSTLPLVLEHLGSRDPELGLRLAKEAGLEHVVFRADRRR